MENQKPNTQKSEEKQANTYNLCNISFLNKTRQKSLEKYLIFMQFIKPGDHKFSYSNSIHNCIKKKGYIWQSNLTISPQKLVFCLQ